MQFLKMKLISVFCLGLIMSLLFLGQAQAAVTISDPVVIDEMTQGDWKSKYGECFYLLPGPIEDGKEELVGPGLFSTNPEQYENNTCFGGLLFDQDACDWRIFRDTDLQAPAWTARTGFELPLDAQQNPGCFGALDGASLMDTPRGTTWDDGDLGQIGDVTPPLVVDKIVDFTGPLTIAYYFVNGEANLTPSGGPGGTLPECRTQDFKLSVDGVVKTGTIGNFQFGKYVVFDIDGLDGPTTIRFEVNFADTVRNPAGSGVDVCADELGDPFVDFIPGVNNVISGVFIDNCDCIDIEKLVSVDGGKTFVDADECADAPSTESDAEYKLVVTNCGAVTLTDVTVMDPVLNDLNVNIGTLGPGEVKMFTKTDDGFGNLDTPGICPNGPQIENTATVTTNEGPTDSDDACVKCGPCIKIRKNVRDAENTSGTYQPANRCEPDILVPINNGAEYRLRVENCGPEDLRDVVINDSDIEIVNFFVGDLAVGQTKTFFFDRPDGGIPELLQPDLCQEISPELEFLNRSFAEGIGVDSGITVTDSNPACVECQPECDITVTKTCEILSPEPPLLGKCSGKLQEVVVIWNGAGPIALAAGAGVTSLSANQVDPGDELTIFTDGSTNDVFVNISGSVNGESKFHISCSDRDMNADNDNGDQQQLPGESQDCGKFQGNAKSTSGFINTWLLEGMLDADDLRLDCTPQETFPTETEECEFTPQPEGGNCDDIKDITALTLVWDGPDGLNIVSEVGQVINGINNGDVILLNTPKDQTGNDVEVTLTGSVTGASEFHISCSDDDMDGPEDCGSAQGNGKDDDAGLNNQWLFGGMTGEKGSFGCPGVPGPSDSAEVVYGIRVENPNDEPVDVRIVDVKLGIDQTETIPANDTFEQVTDPITITPDESNEFTNTVLVTAEGTLTGATCEASDSVTVKRNPPPPPPVSCSDIKDITAVSVIWTGPGPVDVVMESGEMFEDVMTGNQITFQESNTGNDVEMTISGAVNGMSEFHVSCSDEDMNGSEDCGTAQGNGKGNDASLVNLWLLDGMTGERGSFACNLQNTGVVDPSQGGLGGGYVTGAATLDLGDDKKVKWELTNNGTQDVFVERVVVTWPSQHEMVKKFKLEGDFAKDVFDSQSATEVPLEKAFESDANKRKLKKGDHKRLEIEFTKDYKVDRTGMFTIEVEFDTGEILTFP